MEKQEVLKYLEKEGITSLSVRHPNTPKAWVLEFLFKKYEDREDMKEYYSEFINFHFS